RPARSAQRCSARQATQPADLAPEYFEAWDWCPEYLRTNSSRRPSRLQLWESSSISPYLDLAAENWRIDRQFYPQCLGCAEVIACDTSGLAVSTNCSAGIVSGRAAPAALARVMASSARRTRGAPWPQPGSSRPSPSARRP